MNLRRCYVKLIMSAFSAICLVFPLTGSATENNPGGWVTFSATDAFQTDGGDSRWHYWIDAQARYFDLGSGVNQWLLRPGVGYQISDSIKGWVGYARFRSRNRAGSIADENRYWQQINWSAGRWNGGQVSMRARLEQRSVSNGGDTGLVLRLMAKYVRPIGQDANTNLVLGIEPFVDLRDTDWGGESGLGQNRLIIGIGRRLSDRVFLEAGYMNQYIWTDNGENRINHLGVFNFRVKL